MERAARKAAKRATMAGPIAPIKPKTPIFKQWIFWSIVIATISVGFRFIFPDADSAPLIYVFWVIWTLAFVVLLVELWRHFKWNKWLKVGAVVVAAALFILIAHKNIADRLRPSFVFVIPGPLFNNDTWDLLVNHRGAKPSYNVQILFQDEDRQNYLIKSRTSLSPGDIASYMAMLSYPEVDPMGRGSVFAQQFQWKPFNLEHSHFSVDITSRDIRVSEEIEIVRVSGKWQYLISATDPETHRSLLACRDKDFPSTQSFPQCYPDFAKPGI